MTQVLYDGGLPHGGGVGGWVGCRPPLPLAHSPLSASPLPLAAEVRPCHACLFLAPRNLNGMAAGVRHQAALLAAHGVAASPAPSSDASAGTTCQKRGAEEEQPTALLAKRARA